MNSILVMKNTKIATYCCITINNNKNKTNAGRYPTAKDKEATTRGEQLYSSKIRIHQVGNPQTGKYHTQEVLS